MGNINTIHLMAHRAGMKRKQLDAVADNVANSTTNGYKQVRVDFQEIVAEKMDNTLLDKIEKPGTRIDFTHAPITSTGNPLDVAIPGQGFFAIDVDGQQVFTRNGQFTISPEGDLITASGHQVLDANFGPINLPAGATTVKISPDGLISTDQGDTGPIGVFNFDKEGKKQLVRAGNIGFMLGEPQQGQQPATPSIVETPVVMQGSLESSNVSAIEQTTKLSDISNAYQKAMKLMKQVEDLEIKGIREISKLPN